MSCIINYYTLHNVHNDTLCIEASSHGEYDERKNKTSKQTCDTPSHQIVVRQEENKLAKSFGKLLHTMCKLCWWQGKPCHHERFFNGEDVTIWQNQHFLVWWCDDVHLGFKAYGGNNRV
jgi:hypothetical protein